MIDSVFYCASVDTKDTHRPRRLLEVGDFFLLEALDEGWRVGAGSDESTARAKNEDRG